MLENLTRTTCQVFQCGRYTLLNYSHNKTNDNKKEGADMESKDYRLNDMKSAMCHVNIKRFCDADEDGSITVELWSYYTKVVTITYTAFEGVCSVRSQGYFSPSTARHINRFTNEFLGENLYSDIKSACGKDCGRMKIISVFNLEDEPTARTAFCRALETYHVYGKRFRDYTKSEVERFKAYYGMW